MPLTTEARRPSAGSQDAVIDRQVICVDGNEAVARIAHRLSEVIAIYPITPASPMGELADAWSSFGRTNLWGAVPDVIEMQSEAGAAGALHGALQKGALGTTFTASQGLLLMIPNMFKIAGELTPTVIHVAARTIATHALSIFGDHSDVMAARSTGFAMLCSSSVQEAHDLALISHAATLTTRIPFLHFFDGFRTSHEVAKIEALDDSDLTALVDHDLIAAHRARGLDPDAPVLRGSAQNPDVFFQAREAANPFYASVPGAVERAMEALAARSGRRYRLIDYCGAPDAERVLAIMGSGCGAAEQAVEALVAGGEKVGLLKIRLFRPFSRAALAAALPETVRSIAVLDRTKEPGASGEPLYEEIVTALAENANESGSAPARTVGGRYGLSSKEFTPAMAKRVLDELGESRPRNHFTVGIVDDVTHTSLAHDPEFSTDTATTRAIFFGLGSDGTVSANKNSVKIIGETTDLFAQGYFVYDSKKAGSVTTSHVRVGPDPINSSYLIERASFVACHQWPFLERIDVLSRAEPGATVLLNSAHGLAETWEHLPVEVQRQIIDRQLEVYVIDAYRVAADAGMGKRINTVMQPCFFALSGILPREQAIAAIKRSIEKTYSKRGAEVVERNHAAVDAALGALHRIDVPERADGMQRRRPPVPEQAPDFVQRVTARMLAGDGDLLPVSALPVDGSFPTGTAKWEKRGIAQEIPIWDPEICIDCGRCAFYCPHDAIQMKVYDPGELDNAPAGFQSKDFRSKEAPGTKLSIQVTPDDCTGCGVCVDMCPAKSKQEVRHRAVNMEPVTEHGDRERANFEYFDEIERIDPTLLNPGTVKNSQTRESLFQFSGACAGCGETPYLKLLTQLFGDRILVANATGCSSIYGGNLPTTPWSTNADGRGPAWSNSLFEDNAEFGLGMRLAYDHCAAHARRLLSELGDQIGDPLVARLLEAEQSDDAQIAAQREAVEELRGRLETIADPRARELETVAAELVRRSVWIVGGDGWAYDIGSAGLDHTLASGRNVNVLVLDTEVYSNTGGQASKATPRGAIAKFAAAGKSSGKKDLGMIATAYGDVYVAQVAIGANPTQTVKAMIEAEQWSGPSLILAYSSCIAHGIDMTHSMSIQDEAVKSGYWPLWRYHPGTEPHQHPLQLDSKEPSIPFSEFARKQARFAILERRDPGRARELAELAQADIDERWRLRRQLADVERTVPHTEGEPGT